MKISVVVPVYNVEKYIYECLESIKKQTHTDFECILVDDGSTDSSGKICDKYAETDNRFRVIHKPNGGLVSARKTGVSNALCQYVCFVDSDDFLTPSFIESFSDIIEKFSPDMIANNCIETYCDGQITKYTKSEACGFYAGKNLDDLKEKLVYDETEKQFNMGVLFPSLWSKCIKTSMLLKQYVSSDESISMGEDVMISFPIALKCESIYITCFEGYLYRKNSESIVNKFNHKRFNMIKDLSRYLNNQMPSHKKQISLYTLYRIYSDVISAGKATSTTTDFVQLMKSKFTKQEIKEYTNISIKNILLKNKIIVFFIKRRAWRLLYFIIKHHK